MFKIHSDLCNFNLKLGNKQYEKIGLMHMIVAPQISGGWQHNYSTKARQAGHAKEQSVYNILSLDNMMWWFVPCKFFKFSLYICEQGRSLCPCG
jgi:hypothetical protein